MLTLHLHQVSFRQKVHAYFNGFDDIYQALANLSYVVKAISDITNCGFWTNEVSKMSLSIHL